MTISVPRWNNAARLVTETSSFDNNKRFIVITIILSLITIGDDNNCCLLQFDSHDFLKTSYSHIIARSTGIKICGRQLFRITCNSKMQVRGRVSKDVTSLLQLSTKQDSVVRTQSLIICGHVDNIKRRVGLRLTADLWGIWILTAWWMTGVEKIPCFFQFSPSIWISENLEQAFFPLPL